MAKWSELCRVCSRRDTCLDVLEVSCDYYEASRCGDIEIPEDVLEEIESHKEVDT